MANNYFMGLDVSTQSTKLVVIDYDAKETVFLDTINYDSDLSHYNTNNGVVQDAGFGVSESDPNMWIEAINILFKKLSEKGGIIKKIKSISVSGQQHGLVTITANGELSRPYSKLWNDFSTSEECAIMTEKSGGVDKMINFVGNSQRTGYTAAKILHMVRNEPENWKNTATVFLVHNYINWWLTGGKENNGVEAMEPGDVSGSAIWNPKTKDWADNVINDISSDLKSKLPPVKDSREAIGLIGKNLVKEYGFSPDCKIASGSGDNMMGAIGTGNFKEGIVTVSLGTSGTVYSFMKQPYIDPDGEIAAFCDATNNYLPLLCISNLANGYNSFISNFNVSHEKFDAIVDKTSPGNGGRVLLPWYEGERTPDLPEAAPVYFGFKIEDFTQEIIGRAVLEGHIMNLYEGFLKLPVKPSEIRLTGGMSQSIKWRESIANVFNCEVVPVLGEGAAAGAALHAAWTFYDDKSIEEVCDGFIKLDESQRVKPNVDIVKIYNKYKEIYFALSQRVRGVSTDKNPFKLFKDFNE